MSIVQFPYRSSNIHCKQMVSFCHCVKGKCVASRFVCGRMVPVQNKIKTNNNNNNNCIQRRNSRLFTISSQRRQPFPTRTLKWPGRNRVQITCNTSSAYHVQHVLLRATWYEGTAQLLSLTELKSNLFELYFIG